MRLNRFLASCGLGSRRGVETLITGGRVAVNGEHCRNLGTQVNPGDEVRVDGKVVSEQSYCTLIFNKTRGLICTRSDEKGRTTIYDHLPSRFRPLAHVGRLDLESEGLIVLTNNGDLAQRLAGPGSAVDKEYLVTIDQAFDLVNKSKFLDGIHTEEGLGKVQSIDVISPRRLRIVLHQGLKRQIRVMLQACGYRVTKLLRIRIGCVELEGLAPGKWKELNSREIQNLEQNSAPKKARLSERPRPRKPKPSLKADRDRDGDRDGNTKPRPKGHTKRKDSNRPRSKTAPRKRPSDRPGSSRKPKKGRGR